MTKPDNVWPPPPIMSPCQRGLLKNYSRLKSIAWVLLCYALCLILLYIIELWNHPDIWKRPENLSFWIERFLPFWFASHMLILICFHLLIVMLFQRLLGIKSRNWLALVSACWGSVLAVALWSLYNLILGGYDPTCDPNTGLFSWGCGISRSAIAPLLIAGSVTGYLVGCILGRQKAPQPAV